MAKTEVLTLASVLRLAVSPSSLYLVAYAWLFGMSVWVTFFGGIIAFRTLPRQQFGTLQHKTFPIYFVISIGISGTLMGLWASFHPDVMTSLHRPCLADVAQLYVLSAVLLCQGFNYFVIGPLTSKTMFQRHRLEREEGKAYSEPDVSAEMKALNKRFGMLHGMSSLANLGAVIALGLHGLWLGHAGVNA